MSTIDEGIIILWRDYHKWVACRIELNEYCFEPSGTLLLFDRRCKLVSIYSVSRHSMLSWTRASPYCFFFLLNWNFIYWQSRFISEGVKAERKSVYTWRKNWNAIVESLFSSLWSDEIRAVFTPSTLVPSKSINRTRFFAQHTVTGPHSFYKQLHAEHFS